MYISLLVIHGYENKAWTECVLNIKKILENTFVLNPSNFPSFCSHYSMELVNSRHFFWQYEVHHIGPFYCLTYVVYMGKYYDGVKKIHVKILTNLHIYSTPKYENVVFGMSSVCTSVWMCILLAPEWLGWRFFPP
jgi:hypothetical protein